MQTSLDRFPSTFSTNFLPFCALFFWAGGFSTTTREPVRPSLQGLRASLARSSSYVSHPYAGERPSNSLALHYARNGVIGGFARICRSGLSLPAIQNSTIARPPLNPFNKYRLVQRGRMTFSYSTNGEMVPSSALWTIYQRRQSPRIPSAR